jgi:hypothetical protein
MLGRLGGSDGGADREWLGPVDRLAALGATPVENHLMIVRQADLDESPG